MRASTVAPQSTAVMGRLGTVVGGTKELSPCSVTAVQSLLLLNAQCSVYGGSRLYCIIMRFR